MKLFWKQFAHTIAVGVCVIVVIILIAFPSDKVQ